ncbi:MAG: hypothetical protein FRX49_07732 [Trebouxia sp. A1-2]|nr:MAG: hypothetical protein FRX49_07732 [Trebouxia sp. A1-2]
MLPSIFLYILLIRRHILVLRLAAKIVPDLTQRPQVLHGDRNDHDLESQWHRDADLVVMAIFQVEPGLCMGLKEPVSHCIAGPIHQTDGQSGTLQPLHGLHQIIATSPMRAPTPSSSATKLLPGKQALSGGGIKGNPKQLGRVQGGLVHSIPLIADARKWEGVCCSLQRRVVHQLLSSEVRLCQNGRCTGHPSALPDPNILSKWPAILTIFLGILRGRRVGVGGGGGGTGGEMPNQEFTFRQHKGSRALAVHKPPRPSYVLNCWLPSVHGTAGPGIVQLSPQQQLPGAQQGGHQPPAGGVHLLQHPLSTVHIPQETPAEAENTVAI